MGVCQIHAQSHTLSTVFPLLFGTVDAREYRLRNPSGFPLDGGSTRTSWSFLCVHISWGKLIVDYLWRSLHFAGLALRSLDPSSDCLSDNIPLGVCIVIMGM